MKRLAFIAIASLAALGSIAADAAAVPDTVTFTGRVSDGSGPINGTVNLTFEIFDVPTGGSFIWDEAYTGVSASNGLVYVNLGSQQPFTTVEADGGDLYLQITVNGTVQTPRIPINSVPYATHAGTAASLGTLAPGDVALSTHNHNAAYAAISHNHSSDYAALSHGHGSADIDAYQDLSDSGRFGADAATDVLLRSEGDTRYSASAHTHSYAPLSHSHAAADITSGTLDNARYDSYAELNDAGRFGNNATTDILLQSDGDGRYSLTSHTHGGGGGPETGTNGYVWLARSDNGVNGQFGTFQYFHHSPHFSTNGIYESSVGGQIALSAGRTYAFGCMVNADGTFVGNNFQCNVSWHCLAGQGGNSAGSGTAAAGTNFFISGSTFTPGSATTCFVHLNMYTTPN